MRQICMLVLVLLTCACVRADVARFDPPDPRLEKKVTLEVSHTKLEEVAKSLTEQTGVTIKAGTGTRDWKVREQHITACVKDAPLSRVLDQLAGLHTFRLSREGKEKEWTYTLWQDKSSRDLEAEMLSAEKEARAQRAKEQCQASIDLAKKAAGLTPDEARKLRDKDPMLAYMGSTKSGRGFAQLMASLSSTELDLMLRGRPVAIPFSSLPAALQQAAMDTTLGGVRAAERAQRPDGQDWKPLQLVLKPVTEDDGGDMGAMGAGGAIALMGAPAGGGDIPYHSIYGLGHPMSVFLLAKPGSQADSAFAEALFTLEDGGTLKDFGESFKGAMNEAAVSEASAHESETEKNPPTDPALTREVELGKLPESDRSADDKELAESDRLTAVEISKACEFSVLLESYAGLRTPIVTHLREGKQPLYKILVGLEKAGYTWKIEDSTLRIRPEDWATRRACAIPEATLKRYGDLMESQGLLTIDDVAGIAAELSDDQIIKTLFRLDADLGYAASCLNNRNNEIRSILCLYSTLSAAQKASIGSKQGLRFGELSNQQWDMIAGMVNDRVGGLYIIDGFIRDPSPKDDDPSAAFDVTAVTDDQRQHRFTTRVWLPDRQSMSWRIETRKKAREKGNG